MKIMKSFFIQKYYLSSAIKHLTPYEINDFTCINCKISKKFNCERTFKFLI